MPTQRDHNPLWRRWCVQRKQPQESQAAKGHSDNRPLCQVGARFECSFPSTQSQVCQGTAQRNQQLRTSTSTYPFVPSTSLWEIRKWGPVRLPQEHWQGLLIPHKTSPLMLRKRLNSVPKFSFQQILSQPHSWSSLGARQFSPHFLWFFFSPSKWEPCSALYEISSAELDKICHLRHLN